MLREFLFLLQCLVAVQSSTRTIPVNGYQCDNSFNIEERTTFIYDGDYLSFPCSLKFKTSDVFADICVKTTTYDVTCNVKLEYHNGIVLNSYNDGEVDCHSSNPHGEHCTALSSLYVVFKRTDTSSSFTPGLSRIEFEVYAKSDDDIVEDVRNAVGIVIGVIVGIILLLGIVSVVVIVVCCKRRSRRAPGMVYNTAGTQQMQTTVIHPGQYPQPVTGYPAQPMPQQQPNPGNQPAGYQPMPQQQPYPGNQPAGYQPIGHGQPMMGFAPPPQPANYGAGYQPPPSYSDADKVASAPPMNDAYGTEPPPYPGN